MGDAYLVQWRLLGRPPVSGCLRGFGSERGVLLQTPFLFTGALPDSLAINDDYFRDMLASNLEQGNVTLIATEPSEGDEGILVDLPLVYDTEADLSLVTNGGVKVNRSVQNSGIGDVNTVAGWDGSTGVYKPAASPGPRKKT